MRIRPFSILVINKKAGPLPDPPFPKNLLPLVPVLVLLGPDLARFLGRLLDITVVIVQEPGNTHYQANTENSQHHPHQELLAKSV